jgi:hypothetical protein
MPKQLSSAKTKATEREAVLAAAIAEGKLVEASLPAWRKAFDRDPAATQAELRQLVGATIYNPGRASAPVGDKESRLLAGTQAALGLPPSARSGGSTTPPAPLQRAPGAAGAEAQRPNGQGAVEALRGGATPKRQGDPLGAADPLTGQPRAAASPGEGQSNVIPPATIEPASVHLFGGAAQPAPAPGKAQIVRTESGNVRYGDAVASVPTMMSAWGQLMVFYGSDWQTIDSFEKLGLLPEHSAMSIQATEFHGGAEAKRRLNAGLPTGHALGMV